MDSMFLSNDQKKRECISEEEMKVTRSTTVSESSLPELPTRWADRNLFNMQYPELEDDLFVESGRTCLSDGVIKDKVNLQTRKYNILICTDFTFPNFGGVETHGYQIAQCLIERGHNVCFLTTMKSEERFGVRYMANGMKIYHVPQIPIVANATAFLTFMNSLPVMREILIRERIDIVHGHQCTSILGNTVLMAAKTCGVKTCFTEHSLFTFNEHFGIHLNKIIKWTMKDLDAAICVSNACKENFVLRAGFDPTKAFTIPNAVDSVRFTPDFEIRNQEVAKCGNPDRINIVYISRLQYRKGVDLLIPIIPKILAANKNVHFIIGGDGDGMANLQQLIQRHNISDRVELLGGLPHEKVRDVLCRGHIFLNTSLTESFCIAILEAACCGLLVVSTDVGGVPEVLPPHMAYFAKPEEKSITKQLIKAIENVKSINTEGWNEELSKIYNWRTVAEKTEKVYNYAMDKPAYTLYDRLKNCLAQGQIFGFFAVWYVIMEMFVLAACEYILPDADIDQAQNFNSMQYNEKIEEYGDHMLYVNNKDTRVTQKSQEIIVNPDFLNTTSQPTKFNSKRRFRTAIVQQESKLTQEVPQKPEPVEKEDPNHCKHCNQKIAVAVPVQQAQTQTVSIETHVHTTSSPKSREFESPSSISKSTTPIQDQQFNGKQMLDSPQSISSETTVDSITVSHFKTHIKDIKSCGFHQKIEDAMGDLSLDSYMPVE